MGAFDSREHLFARILYVRMASGQPLAKCDSAAMGRRQRRHRSWLRHERMTVAMALAEKLHHSGPRRQTTARAGGGVRDVLYGRVPEDALSQAAGALYFASQTVAMALAECQHHSAQRPKMARAGEEGHEDKYNAPRRQKPPPPQAFFQVFDEEDAERGVWPARLAEPQEPQERVQLRTVEHIADVVPMVQILDIPVPQMVDQLVEVCRHLDFHIPEQVIEVPKISASSCRSRRVLVAPQKAEQLVKVPTIVSYSSLQGIVEQNADIPVPPGRGGRAGRFSQGLDSTSFGGADLVDIPVPRGGGLHGSRPRQVSIASSSHSRDADDEAFTEVLRTFHQNKKVRSLAGR